MSSQAAWRDYLALPASADELRRIQHAGLSRAVEQARRSAFFKGRLAHINPAHVHEAEEWAKIPVLDKDMLRGMTDRVFYDEFCIVPQAGDSISEFWRSGGSTGRPLFYPRTHKDLSAAMRGFSRVLDCAGAPASSRVHCSFPLGIHPVGQVMARAAERLGMSVLMAGAGTTTPSLLQLELMDRLRPNIWTGMSSYGLHLANLADAQGRDLAAGPVDFLVCSAEPLSDAKRAKLERMWGATVCDGFGMTEAGMMGAEDGRADGFRIWSDMFHVEVVDPSTHEPVADGEAGALFVTALQTNHCTPFLRWLSGDIVTMQRHAPGKGAYSIFPVIKHAHRTAGFFKVRGINLNHGEFEDFVFSEAAVNDFKGEALTLNDQDVLRVSIEVKRGMDAQEVAQRMTVRIKQVFEITAEVVLLETGTLAQEFESSIKAPRMVDRRNAS